ncbi:MAG: zinc-ribbon and DUF3426 domain-containing protein [Burkholderiaceae bacterium]
MSLATRCPACHTVFRVVQDQLRVSEGWVRCGQCQEVFNALETLFDLDQVDPAEASAPAQATQPPAPPAASAEPGAELGAEPDAAPSPVQIEAPPPSEAAPAEDWPDFDEQPSPRDHWDPAAATVPMRWDELPDLPEAAPVARPGRAETPPAKAAAVDAPAAAQVDAAAVFAPPAPAPDEEAPSTLASEPATVADADPEAEPTPSRFMGPMPGWAAGAARERRRGSGAKRSSSSSSKSSASKRSGEPHAHATAGAHRRRRKPQFVRQAERAALWRRPLVRALLGGASGVLGLMLVAQVAFQYRDHLAVQVPALAAPLQAACARLGCRIEAPRALDRIRLDASDLTRTEDEHVLRFSADLHNSADFAVRTPALEVSFTDGLGQTVSRKVMLPAELGARSESIAADAQWRVDARLAVGELRVAGYTVEVFYP